MSLWQGACDTTSAKPTGVVVFRDGTREYNATAAGKAHITCEQGNIVLDVRPIHRIEIEGPGTTRIGDKLSFVLRAFDKDGNPLVFGEGDPISWEFTGSVRPRAYPACGDLTATCSARNSGYAAAWAPGHGQVKAVFHGREAVHQVDVAMPDTTSR